MKQISVEIERKRAVLGRLAPVGETRRHVNTVDAVETWWSSEPANADYSPNATPNVGLLSSTRIRKPDGVVSLDEVHVGDVVLDHNMIETRVTTISRAGASDYTLRLRAPYFGLDQDLVVGPKQCLWFTSEYAEHLFETAEVLVPVWALRDQNRVTFNEPKPRETFLEIKLESGGAVLVGDCALAPKTSAVRDGPKELSDSEARGFATYFRSGFSN